MYLSRISFFKIGIFATVGAHGRTGGDSGGSCLRGNEQEFLSADGTPELEHCVQLIWLIILGTISSHAPICGKLLSIIPRSKQASNDK